MAREYFVLEDVNIRESAKPLISVAIHPSGYYMAASFIDKIRFHHILHDEFKHYKNIELRYCRLMKFSTGGHLFSCIDDQQLHLYNSYTIERTHSINLAVPAKQISQILFNDRDMSVALVGSGGYSGRWALPSYKCIEEKVEEDKLQNYASMDFVHKEV